MNQPNPNHYNIIIMGGFVQGVAGAMRPLCRRVHVCHKTMLLLLGMYLGRVINKFYDGYKKL